MSTSTSKPVLAFDTTILAQGNIKGGGRSGIFWASWNLFQQFAARTDIDLWIYCQPPEYAPLHDFLTQQFPGRKFPLVNRREINWFTYQTGHLRARKERCKQEKRTLQKHACHLLSLPFRIADTCLRGPWDKALDQVHYFFSPMYALPPQVKANTRIRKGTMLYDAMPITHPQFFPDGSPWFHELVASLNAQDLYFTDSESARQDFLKVAPQIPPQHIHTAYIGPNLPYQPETDPARIQQVKEKYHIPADKSYVFSLCTMDKRKNIPFAIDGFIRFCEQNHIQNQVLVLGGAMYDTRLSKYKTSPYVQFIGYVDDEDLQTLYSAANAFVYPSLYEGFGMPILEAMSCACPVICSNTSSMPEVLGDAGLLIDPTDPASYVAALQRYYSDEPFRQACAQKGLARAGQFSWKKCSELIVDCLLHPEKTATP